MTIYPLGDILGWIVHGWYQRTIVELDLFETWWKRLLAREQKTPPQFWLDCHSWKSWTGNLTDGYPNLWWCTLYNEAAWRAFGNWVDSGLALAKKAVIDTVRGFTGNPKQGFPTLSDWIGNIWDKMPASVHAVISSWSGAWGDLQSKAKKWFDAVYGWLKDKANAAKAWVDSAGAAIKIWVDDVRFFVSSFKANPYGRIKDWLGNNWDNLLAFLSGPLVFVFGDSAFKVTWLVNAYEELSDFYNNVWVPSKIDLHDFLDHPLLWLYDQAEDFLCGMW